MKGRRRPTTREASASCPQGLCSVETLMKTNIKYHTQGLVFVAATSSSTDRTQASSGIWRQQLQIFARHAEK